MEDGICVDLFRQRSMALVQHSGGYCVAELLSDEVSKGDRLQGDWNALGSERVRNLTQGCWQEVYLQGSWGSVQACG